MTDLFPITSEQLILMLGFLLITVASNQIARVFQQVKLPLITGLLFTGILSGPYVLGLIPIAVKVELDFINEIALAYIAFAAGAELYLNELRSKLRTIQIISIVQSIVGFLLGVGLVYLVLDFIPFAASLPTKAKWAISMLMATLFIAPSPASIIAVISELRAKGPFTQTVLGVIMAKDFIVVVLFAIVLSIAKPMVSNTVFEFSSLGFLALELALSFLLAFLVGKFLHWILRFGRNKWVKTILVLVLGFLNYEFSDFAKAFSLSQIGHELYFEPLLICLIASFYVSNYTAYRAEFIKILQDISLYVYVAFFTLTGASMNLDLLSQVLLISLVLFLMRLVTILVGALLGSALAKEPTNFYKVSWMPYVAQAGVALGLVTVIAGEFPEWGSNFATISIAVIILNQLVGPPLISKAIGIVGEDRRKAVSGHDGIRDAIIFGYESQSVALARQLKEKGWDVQIATKLSKGSIEEPDNIKIIYDINGFTREEFLQMNADKTEAIVTMLSDEENLKICETAYQHFGTRDIIVRLNHRQNYEKFLALGAKIVDPSTAIVSLLDHFVRSPQATSLLLGMEKGQDTRDIEVMNSDIHGLPLRDLRLPSDVIILSIMRGGQTIISHGYTRLRARDIVTVVGSIKSLDEVQLKFER